MNYLDRHYLILDYGQDAFSPDEKFPPNISYRPVRGLDSALDAYVEAIKKNTKNSIDIYLLEDDFDWDNPLDYLDGNALFSWDPYFDIYVAKVNYNIFVPIILMKEAKSFFERFDLPIDVYKYHGNIKKFFSENWKDFLGKHVY
jgi:hypothetical protein